MLQSGSLSEVFVTETTAERQSEVIEWANAATEPDHVADDHALATLSDPVTPQGLVAVCDSITVDVADVLGQRSTLLAVLAEVREPGNAGTVIRISGAAGADAVILTHGSVDPHSGKAVRASAGSVFHLPIAAGPSITDVVSAVKALGLTVLASDGAGSTDLDVATDEALLAQPTAWIFGNEAWGLPDNVRALADHVVRVPSTEPPTASI